MVHSGSDHLYELGKNGWFVNVETICSATYVGAYFYYAALEKFFDLLQAQRVMLFTYKSRGN